MHFDWDQIISPIIGGSIGLGLAKYLVTSTAEKIETIAEKLSDIKSQLSSMQVKLELLEKLHDLCSEHEKKIAVLETKGEKNDCAAKFKQASKS
jgi:hypothetical protein